MVGNTSILIKKQNGGKTEINKHAESNKSY